MNPLRVLIVHSDIGPNAPPDELDTLVQADAVKSALEARGHCAEMLPYTPDGEHLRSEAGARGADLIFNLVESIDGSGILSARAPLLFQRLGLSFTGAKASELALTCDKPRTKALLRKGMLPTPDWSEPPDWAGLDEGRTYIVKSALEDASVGLDDGSVVSGRTHVRDRAKSCEAAFGGSWFAEAYVDGREFNVAVVGAEGGPVVLPLAEMTFQEWETGRPRIVGYTAKWHDESFEATRTVRAFGLETGEPLLAASLRDLAARTWTLLGLSGYARIDFRVDDDGPTILEINPNPCLSPDAGFAAAAAMAGMTYPVLIERIARAALS